MPSQSFPGVREMVDAREYPLTTPNYNTPVKDLKYKDLLTRTFTQTSHDRVITYIHQENYSGDKQEAG